MLTYLLSMASADDLQMVMELYDAYHDDMIRFAKKRLKNAGLPNYESDAEDVVEEAFLRILKYIESVRCRIKPQTERAYIFTVVANVIKVHLSNQTYWCDIEECESYLEDPDDFIERLRIKERYQEVVGAVMNLDEIYKMVFVYQYQYDKSTKEISEMLDLPLSTVQTRLWRGKKKLLSMLGDEE